MKKVAFKGWKNCVELNSGKFKLYVTTDVGPRVIGGFLDGSDNIFCVKGKTAGKTGGDKWNIYGGHRLWHSPEIKPRTYQPDNVSVTVKEIRNGGASFSNATEAVTGIKKEIRIIPLGNETFRVEHYLRNEGAWDVELAAWSLSVMAPGGVAVIPQNPNYTSLLPNKFVSVWSYTSMSDPRITWGKDFILVRQDSKLGKMKIGLNCEAGWLGYINNGVAFVKKFDYFADGEYPDNGCSIEVFSNTFMLEAETLSPLYLLAPGDEILHVEIWNASKVESHELASDKDVAEVLTPVKKTAVKKAAVPAKKTTAKPAAKAAAPAKKTAAKKTAAKKK